MTLGADGTVMMLERVSFIRCFFALIKKEIFRFVILKRDHYSFLLPPRTKSLSVIQEMIVTITILTETVNSLLLAGMI